jgi:hypothetical protein
MPLCLAKGQSNLAAEQRDGPLGCPGLSRAFDELHPPPVALVVFGSGT